MDQEMPAGAHAVEWDGTTAGGGNAASGIYLLVMSGDIPEKRFKIAVIR